MFLLGRTRIGLVGSRGRYMRSKNWRIGLPGYRSESCGKRQVSVWTLRLPDLRWTVSETSSLHEGRSQLPFPSQRTRRASGPGKKHVLSSWGKVVNVECECGWLVLELVASKSMNKDSKEWTDRVRTPLTFFSFCLEPVVVYMLSFLIYNQKRNVHLCTITIF